jgi:hypothetical protein
MIVKNKELKVKKRFNRPFLLNKIIGIKDNANQQILLIQLATKLLVL